MNVPTVNQGLFGIILILTAIFIPFSSANVIAWLYDITLLEVRSTALSIQYFIENGGAALALLLVGIIAKNSSLHLAKLSICVSAWILVAIFLAATTYLVPKDIQAFREQMKNRAELERKKLAS